MTEGQPEREDQLLQLPYRVVVRTLALRAEEYMRNEHRQAVLKSK